MTATATIQRVRELAASRLADAESRYDALVELLAAGGMPDPEDVLATLADVDRTDADLQLDVDKLEGLARAKTTIAAAEKAAARIAAIQQERAELKAQLEAYQLDIGRRDAALATELGSLESAQIRASDAQAAIASGRFDLASAKSRRAEASSAIAKVGGRRVNLQTELGALRRELAALESASAVARERHDRIRPGEFPADTVDLATLNPKILAARNRIAAIERELIPIDTELARANGVFAELNGAAV